MRLLLCALVVMVLGCSYQPPQQVLEKTNVKVDDFYGCFEVVKVVSLGKSSQQYLSKVDKVIPGPALEGFFIGDFSQSQVIRVDGEGNLQHVYVVKGEGPGELQNVLDLRFENGVLTIFGLYKAVMFTPEGDLVFERTFSGGDDLVALCHGTSCGDSYFVKKSEGKVFVINNDTTVREVIHFNDDRLDYVNFRPSNPISCYRNSVFIADNFDLKLYEYGSENRIHEFSYSDMNFSGLTRNDPDPASKMKIISKKLEKVNRWEVVLGLKSSLFLVRMNFASRESFPVFYYPEKNKMIEFGPINFIRTLAEDARPFSIQGIVGSQGDSIIGIQWDEASLEYMKTRIDGISDPSDPHLIFFRLRTD